VCNSDTWCFFTDDGNSVWCARVEHGSRLRTIAKNGSTIYLHELATAQRVHITKDTSIRPEFPSAQLELITRRFVTAVNPHRLTSLSIALGVTEQSLRRLRIGWADKQSLLSAGTRCQGEGAWAFPMSDGEGRTIGIRLRTVDNFKYAVSGARTGIFIPLTNERQKRLLVCEGPTDLAALLDLNYWAIGRPDCQGGTQFITEYVRINRPNEVIIITDHDPEGSAAAAAVRTGAINTRRELEKICNAIIVRPPCGIKDIRHGLQTYGANRQSIDEWIREEVRRERRRNQFRSNSHRRATASSAHSTGADT
jgi:hypothetical protein